MVENLGTSTVAGNNLGTNEAVAAESKHAEDHTTTTFPVLADNDDTCESFRSLLAEVEASIPQGRNQEEGEIFMDQIMVDQVGVIDNVSGNETMFKFYGKI